MTAQTKRWIIGGAVAALVAIALVIGFWPAAVPVETATVRRAPLRVTVEEEGETHLEDRYVIAAPASAWLRRIDLEVGDSVRAGEAVAYLDPPPASDLDPRSREEAQARLSSALAGLTRAREEARAAETAAATAVSERERLERLHAAGSATARALERAVAEAERAVAEREAARSAVSAARAEVAAARAAARGGEAARDSTGGGGPPADAIAPGVLRAPVGGRVLAVRQRSAGPVSAGQPLVEVGDLDELEVRVDVLSEDAVRIRPGTRVLLDQWGGDGLLEASVRRVEPQGFTDVSSLGVEEKRVWVVARLATPAAERPGLGVGYRVLARFVIWEGDDVLQAPTAALFRPFDAGTGADDGEGEADDGRGDGSGEAPGDRWAAFVVQGGRAVLRSVTVGHEAALAAEVRDGLSEGERVIVHPGNELVDGTRVDARGSGQGG